MLVVVSVVVLLLTLMLSNSVFSSTVESPEGSGVPGTLRIIDSVSPSLYINFLLSLLALYSVYSPPPHPLLSLISLVILHNYVYIYTVPFSFLLLYSSHSLLFLPLLDLPDEVSGDDLHYVRVTPPPPPPPPLPLPTQHRWSPVRQGWIPRPVATHLLQPRWRSKQTLVLCNLILS